MTELQLTIEAEQQQLDTCLIFQNKKLIFCYEKTKGMLQTPARMNSCTKSVVSSLFGIALKQGKIDSVDMPLHQFFSILAKADDFRKQEITLRHALTLTAGFAWQEFGGINSFPAMTKSEHWINYVLSQPLSHQPGTVMNYNSGVSQLLSSVLVQITGQTVASYAEDTLFHALNIQHYQWQQDPQGLHTGGFGLYMAPMDMLKLGMLYLNNGVYDNNRMIEEKVTAEITAPAVEAASPAQTGYYGWHWWIDLWHNNDSEVISYYYARGYGGQFIFVVPSLNAVVVTTKNQKIKGELPIAWFKASLLPLLIQGTAS